MSNISNNTISEQEAQNIFIKICKENQWSIVVKPLRDGIDYVLRKASQLEDRDLPYLAKIEELAPEITFFQSITPFHLRLSYDDRFEFVAGFLEHGNIKTIRKLAFFKTQESKMSINSVIEHEEKGFKTWSDILTVMNYSSTLRPSSVKTVLTKFYGKFTNRELLDIFRKVKDKDYTRQEFHEIISSFCGNHINQLLGNQRLTSYLMSFIKEKCPEQKSFYTTLLDCKDENIEMIFSAKESYEVFHLNKQIMMNRYTLNFAKISTEKDYEDILQHAILFMNKNTDKLNVKSVLMTAQAKDSFYTIIVGTTPQFDLDVLKSFFAEVLRQAVVISEQKNPGGKDFKYATALKQENSKYYKTFLNQITLEKALPEKTDAVLKNNKI